MLDFATLYEFACQRKGGEAALSRLLQRPLTPSELSTIPDRVHLSELCRKIFQSGFVWRVVNNKWANFEELFWGFDIDRLIMMPDDMLERKAKDPRIIRNARKVWAIRDNAMMIHETRRRSNSSFAEFIAHWPTEDIVGLWGYLKQHGNRLGGNIGPYALRALGKDTFLLTRDVEAYLRSHGILTTGSTTKKGLAATQACFNDLRQQSGRSLTELSQIMAFCHGENGVAPA
jgi:3-methyladenine DNA glycosylase Tag